MEKKKDVCTNKGTFSPYKTPVICCGIAISLASIAIIADLISRQYPNAIERYYIPLLRIIQWLLSWISSIAPFSIAEITIYGLVILFSITLIMLIFRLFNKENNKPLLFIRWLAGWILTFAVILFAYYSWWGYGYNQPMLAKEMELDVQPRSVVELQSLCSGLALDLNKLSIEATVQNSVSTLADDAYVKEAAAKVAAEFSKAVGIVYPEVKPVASSALWSYTQTTGIFIPLTGESNVNTNDMESALPFTMAHEMAHRYGVNREDEANFFAFWVLSQSDDPQLCYSATFSAFQYAMSRLYGEDVEAYNMVWNELSDAVSADITAYNTHWKQYDGKIADAAQTVNNTYLQSRGTVDGVKSYGRMVDLLLAYYLNK